MQALDDKDVALQDACAATAAAAAQTASRRTPCSATPPAAYPYDDVSLSQRQHPHVAAESLATAEIEAQGRREDAMAQVDEDVKKCCCFC